MGVWDGKKWNGARMSGREWKEVGFFPVRVEWSRKVGNEVECNERNIGSLISRHGKEWKRVRGSRKECVRGYTYS